MRRITSGRLTLAGGIDGQIVLPFGTPEEVRAEVFTKLDLLWEDGGYLPLPEKMLGVSEENERAMVEAIHEWSRLHIER
jgi:uroporphyrinogen decarboxylase